MTHINVNEAAVDGFVEDKDWAGAVRDDVLMPALEDGATVVLDFDGIDDVSQSFIHVLVAESLRVHGRKALGQIVFQNASEPVRGAVSMVVRYTLAAIPDERVTLSGAG